MYYLIVLKTHFLLWEFFRTPFVLNLNIIAQIKSGMGCSGQAWRVGKDILVLAALVRVKRKGKFKLLICI